MNNQVILVISFVLINTLFLNTLYSQNASDDKQYLNNGFLDFNGYYDTREFSVMTLNILINLSNKVQYFSLTNFQGAKETSDLSTYYTEQNLRWDFKKKTPLQATIQWVSRAGNNNDDLKLGIRWKLNAAKKLKAFFKKLNMFYAVDFHFLEFKHSERVNFFTQLEHVYMINILENFFNKRLYIGGFADQNIIREENGKISFKWVSEHQLGFNIINSLFIVVEYRINDFLPNQNYGFGYGLEYKIKF